MAEVQELAKFFRSLEQFFLTVDQNNFGNKIPLGTQASVHVHTIHLDSMFCVAIVNDTAAEVCSLKQTSSPKILLSFLLTQSM